MARCALERLGSREEWSGDNHLADPADSAGADLAPHAARTGATFVATARLHDATFLNAVLPFALNQARRHNEALSLVCVAIDRLGGIQELLGPGTADRLVRDVADTLTSLVRASDIVARLDDDRVVAVLPRAPGGGRTLRCSENLRSHRGERPNRLRNSQHHGLDRRGDISCLRRRRVLAVRRSR